MRLPYFFNCALRLHLWALIIHGRQPRYRRGVFQTLIPKASNLFRYELVSYPRRASGPLLWNNYSIPHRGLNVNTFFELFLFCIIAPGHCAPHRSGRKFGFTRKSFCANHLRKFVNKLCLLFGISVNIYNSIFAYPLNVIIGDVV